MKSNAYWLHFLYHLSHKGSPPYWLYFLFPEGKVYMSYILIECKLPKRSDFCPFCSLLYSKHLEEYLVHSIQEILAAIILLFMLFFYLFGHAQ